MKAIYPEVSSFLAQSPIRMFVDGQWKAAAGNRTFEVRDPGNGQVIAEVASGDSPDVDLAVTAAGKAFRESAWPSLPVNERAVCLHRLADLIDRDRDILAQLESLDVGKPFLVAQSVDIPNVAQTFRYYAELSLHALRREPRPVAHFEARSFRVPYGVCAFIFPWNFPLLLLGWGTASALAAGNTVVIKPAEDTPLSTLFFCKLVQEAGIPDGVVNVVPGFGETAGAALSRHTGIKRMSFTGSPEVGRLIGESCGRNLVPAKLELGGKGAAVVFDDVDIEAAAKGLAGAITFNTGQVCCTATRWIVQRGIYDRFLGAVSDILNSTVMGYGLEPATQMGPAVSEKQRRRVQGYLDRGREQGAEMLLAGGASNVEGYSNGYYVKPCLLTGSTDNVCWKEEIFGPVAYVVPFTHDAEAIALANRSAYGLANSVWSSNLDRANQAAEALVAGNSWINGHNLFPHGVPYGGCNLSGLGGGVLSPETYYDYLRAQSVVRVL